MTKALWTLDGDFIVFRSQYTDASDIVLRVRITTYARKLAYEYVEAVDCYENADLFMTLYKTMDKVFKELEKETGLFCKLSGNSTFSRINAIATKNILARELRKEFERIDATISDALKNVNYDQDKCWDSVRNKIYNAWESSDNKD